MVVWGGGREWHEKRTTFEGEGNFCYFDGITVPQHTSVNLSSCTL